MMRKVLVFPGVDKDFVIDEGDYRVVSEIVSTCYSWVQGQSGGGVERIVREMVTIEENDEERRVYKLKLEFPFQILVELPEAIENLIKLRPLDLKYFHITALPNSICQLQNLEHLDLSRTEKLEELPEFIGSLTNLKTLDLKLSNITSLPHFIGQLQILEHLDLCFTGNLVELPEEIGNLTNLKSLSLGRSQIASLPHSIGQLQNLEHLDLSWTMELAELPEEIWNLTNLKSLDLDGSRIPSLPNSIVRLTGVTHIYVKGAIEEKYLDQSLWMLVQGCRSLGSLGCIEGLPDFTRKKIDYALACNRARSRTGLGTIARNKPSIQQVTPKLWPRVLNRALQAFQMQDDPYCHRYRHHYFYFPLSQPDAIYQLLVDGRKLFIEMLIHGGTKDTSIGEPSRENQSSTP